MTTTPNQQSSKEDQSLQPQDKKIIKGYLFTIIIFAQATRSVNYLQDLICSILDKFPCHIIMIHGDSTATSSYLNVKKSTGICEQDATIKSINSYHQITIEASKDMFSRVPLIVLPYIMPDLPVYLLWGQNPFEEKEIFPALQPHANRVIFDSECSDDLHLFCEEMQKNLKLLKTDIMDINWALVSNWRDVCCRLFDSPDKIDELKACKTIVINYNNTKNAVQQHPGIRAIYLQGWLAARLKWTYQNTRQIDNNVVINYTSLQGPIEITLKAEKYPDLPSGSIHSIDITTYKDISYTITRSHALPQLVVHVSTLDSCNLPFTVPLADVHKGFTFMKEIFYGKLGTHYQEMLKMISLIDFKTFE